MLKFNPGARETFSFTGPGLFGLKNGYNNGIEPNIYRSAIKIDIAPHFNAVVPTSLSSLRVRVLSNVQISINSRNTYTAVREAEFDSF